MRRGLGVDMGVVWAIGVDMTVVLGLDIRRDCGRGLGLAWCWRRDLTHLALTWALARRA